MLSPLAFRSEHGNTFGEFEVGSTPQGFPTLMNPRHALTFAIAAGLATSLQSKAQQTPAEETPVPPVNPSAITPPAPPIGPKAPPPRPLPSGPIEVNGIAAKVNGKVVTKNQVSFLLSPVFAKLAAQYPRRGQQFESEFKKAKENILQELVDRQIILTEFSKMGGALKPYVVDEEIKRQQRELFNGDEAKFNEELKRSRLNMEAYREMTRQKLIVQAMRANQFSDVPPPLPDEIRKEYENSKLALRDPTKDVISFQKIFIPATDPENPVATPETQLTLAESIAKQISEGKDFAELAKTYSKDAFAEKGGIQEDIPRTDLSVEFAAIIVDAPKDKVIGPLLDPQGFTIVKVLKLVPGPTEPLSNPKMHELIEERVRKQKSGAQYEKWIESKRKQAIVDIKI